VKWRVGIESGGSDCGNIDEALSRAEARQQITLQAGATALDLLQAVYRNPSLPLAIRLRAAAEAIPFEHAKLAVIALGVGSGDFADQLERAIKRSAKVLEHREPKQIGAPRRAYD
jgi:hypothetical protein